MRQWNLTILWSLWIVAAFIGCKAYNNNEAAPIITPADEITVENNLELKLECEHSEDVVWKVHDQNNEDYKFESMIVNNRYTSTVRNNQMSYYDVGYFYCISKNAIDKNPNELNGSELEELLNQKLASRVYVYVNDPEKLLVRPSSELLLAFANKPYIIPCKPTTKDVEVFLTENDGTVSFSRNSSNYDPRTGFKKFVRGRMDVAPSFCRPTNPLSNNPTEKVIIRPDYQAETSILEPIITSSTNGKAWVDGSFELNCEILLGTGVKFDLTWKPPDIDAYRFEQTIVEMDKTRSDIHHSLYSRKLIVKNAKKSDSGNYYCTAKDFKQSKTVTYPVEVLDAAYINLSPRGGHLVYSAKAGQRLTMSAECNSFPSADLTWLRNGLEITNSSKYIFSASRETITIHDVKLEDTGEYIVQAYNGHLSRTLKFNVQIKDKPQVKIENVKVSLGNEAILECQVLALPMAKPNCTFEPCSATPIWPSCGTAEKEALDNVTQRPNNSNIETWYDVKFRPKSAGIVRCYAKNFYGSAIEEASVFVYDFGENLTLSKNDERKIARDDEVTLTCSVPAYYNSNDLKWYKGDEEVATDDSNIEIANDMTDFSYRTSLKFRKIQDINAGVYACHSNRIDPPFDLDSKNITLDVYEPFTPRIISKVNPKMSRGEGERLELECKVESLPVANITWYKDDVIVVKNANITINETLISTEVKYSVLQINPFSSYDQGKYECHAENRLGIEIARTVASLPDDLHPAWIFVIVFFFIVLIALVIYLWIRVRRERKIVRELKLAGLHNFIEGDPTQINQALDLDEQADLLPYDKSFEFPRHKLELGKQLGAGAFGVVHKAEATGIKPGEQKTVVAVKMVKRIADNEAMRALVSELKILIHLGQHLNVVNLLGAVTKNVANRELMVIVEYCRYGNIQNFLLQNRKRFINQINAQSGKIDPSIVTQRFSDNFETSRNGLKYANINFSNHQYQNRCNNNDATITRDNHRHSDNDPRPGTRAGRPDSNNQGRHSDSYEIQMDSCATNQTIMTTIPEDEVNLLSNNTTPPWRSNYETDSTETMPVTTSDLVTWAFQLARGMDYLACRKVLHGDLAARNILLCENNVVKICDFGLARSMLKSDIYKKEGEAPLPIKWLALETLSEGVFSTYTDVWSYGIVLWELFSLAKVPYPGMANKNLYEQLKNGYRMEKPPYANEELYDIMLECWSTNPERRPLFNELENKFAVLLGNEVTNHYVDMNAPYLRANNEYFKNNKLDYMELLGTPPDEIAPAPPRYVNASVLPDTRVGSSIDNDYLQINTDTNTVLFSTICPQNNPSTNDDLLPTQTTTSLNVSDATKHSPTLSNLDRSSPSLQKNRNKQDIHLIGNRQPEEIPMLEKEHHSDNDDAEKDHRHKPTAPPKPTPRHHITETPLISNNDNYVNVGSPKKIESKIKYADAFANPGYGILKTSAK